MLTIVGEADVRPTLEIKVTYHELPEFERLEGPLRESLAAAPLLEYLQIESGRDAQILYIINGKLNHPLREPVRKAFNIRGPARLNFFLARRIVEIEAARIGQAIQSVLPGQEVSFKHRGLG